MTETKPTVMAKKRTKPTTRLWNVEASVPRGQGRHGGGNVTAEVIAYTLEGAIEAVRLKYPDAVLHKVMCGRWVSDVIISREKAPRA